MWQEMWKLIFGSIFLPKWVKCVILFARIFFKQRTNYVSHLFIKKMNRSSDIVVSTLMRNWSQNWELFSRGEVQVICCRCENRRARLDSIENGCFFKFHFLMLSSLSVVLHCFKWGWRGSSFLALNCSFLKGKNTF